MSSILLSGKGETMMWEVKGTAGHEIHGQSVVYDEAGRAIAIVYDGDAHGSLVAAAPELLECLKYAAAWYCDGHVIDWDDDDEEWVNKTRAAINKAEGRK